MAAQWTRNQVLELAPDASAAKAGEGLAKLSAWRGLGQSAQAIWGEIQGSGKNPYQVRIDLAEPAFKCSCPSRKFPCKHSLGLMMIFADKPAAFEPADPPGWVADWLTRRAQRTEEKQSKAAEAAPPDPEARAKRVAKREEKVRGGVEELRLWLADLVRHGLGTAQAQPGRYWETIAARMVDAQAPGLARQVRRLAACTASGAGWQERALHLIGRLHLLLAAAQRIEALAEPLAADVRTGLGWTVPREELLNLPVVEDTWTVLGQRVEQEEQLRVQRTWLWGERSQRAALVLQFAAGAQPFETSFAAGTRFTGGVVYYPSAQPVRAVVTTRAEAAWISPALAAESIAVALDGYAAALAEQPWIELWPLRLGEVTARPPAETGSPWRLLDSAGDSVTIEARSGCGWQLLAIGGGAPVDVFGEWDGEALRPMSVCAVGRFFTVSQGAEGARIVRVA